MSPCPLPGPKRCGWRCRREWMAERSQLQKKISVATEAPASGFTRHGDNNAMCENCISQSVPEEGLVESDDFPVFDHDHPPAADLAIRDVLVAQNVEFGHKGALGILVVEFLGLHVGAEILLAVLKADGEVGLVAGAPEELEVMAVTGA